MGIDVGRRFLKVGLFSRISWRRVKAGRERERFVISFLFFLGFYFRNFYFKFW